MIKQIMAAVVILGIIFAMIYGHWSCKRRWNYKWGYESRVHEQIQKELKPINARLDALEKRK